MPYNIDIMYFSDLSKSFLEIENTSSRLKMTEILAKIFAKTSSEEIDKVCYLLQGRVVPQYEKIEFILAEKLVLKAIIAAFSLSETEVKKTFSKEGDLGKTAETFRKTALSLFPKTEKLTVGQVYKKLYALCLLAGLGSQEGKLSAVIDLLQSLDALSCRYLVRILTNKLRLGFSDMTVLDSLSWVARGDKSLRAEIEPAYNVRPDLGTIAKLVKNKQLKELQKIDPVVGVPVKMARAERVVSPEEIIEKIGKCAIEPKYDGFRLQFHYKKFKTQNSKLKSETQNSKVKIYSRGMEEVSAMFPDLTTAINQEIKVENIIFEGEAVGFDPKTHQYLPFQETVQRKRKYEVTKKSQEIPLKVFVFDVLYCNGKSYLNNCYEDRRKLLRQIFANPLPPKIFQLATETLTADPKIIKQLFEKNINEGLEGIMAKKLSGKYQAGARGWNWIKFKHSYDSKLIDTLDCVVMGYDFGQGKRTGFGLGAFLVGVYDEKKKQYTTLAKIGTGLTDEEWKKMFALCKKNQIKTKPESYLVHKQLPVDVWVKPVIIVEIRADELTKSPMHTTALDNKGSGLALRFPRLEKFREDKNIPDLTTVLEVTKLFQTQRK